ncbi:MAG: flagellar biosynthetic protein FliR [Gemmatimonas sp.]
MNLEPGQLAAAGLPDFFAPGVSAAVVLTALRVGGLFLVAPVWSAKPIPMKLRAALIVIFAVMLAPSSTAGVDLEHLRITPATFLSESAIGLVVGLSAALFIAGAEAAGEQMTVAIGLSGAAIFDPVNNTQGAILAQFMQMLALLIVLMAGGHMIMLRALSDTFRVLPLGAAIDLGAGLYAFVPTARTIFTSGMQFAAPVIAAVLVLNIALAILGRAAPKLQIMSVAFPLQIGVGLLTLAGSLALIVRTIDGNFVPQFGGALETFVHAASEGSPTKTPVAR